MMFLWRLLSDILPTREVIWRTLQLGDRGVFYVMPLGKHMSTFLWNVRL